MKNTTAIDGERRHRPPKVRTLIAFTSLIMLLFCVFVAYQASKAYESAIYEGKSNADRLTAIMADQVELTFLTVDLTLRRAVERQHFNALFGGNLPHDIENNFRVWLKDTPQIAALMLVNHRGDIEVAAHKKGYDYWLDYYRSLRRDPIFTLLRNTTDKEFAVSRRTTTIRQHPELILVSRKISKLDGSFGGIVVAAVDPQYFLKFFRSVDFGRNRFMALTLDDGTPLFIGPEQRSHYSQVLGEVWTQAKKTEETRTPHPQTITSNEAIHIFSFEALQNVPIYTFVVIGEEDFLAGWRDARMKDISFLAIFTIFGSVLSFFALTMAKQIARVEESESAAILASQAKSEFLANMSHELRTPLNAIIGFSEMLNAGYFGPVTDKQKERIQDINLCGTHLLQLISDILEFSKGEAGKLELHEDAIHLGDIMHECVRMLRERAKLKQIAISVDVEPSLPQLWADKRKVRQILINLLSNAIKFTPENGEIKVAAKLDTHQQINMVVTDTGIGIAEEDIPTALSVFGQVHRDQSHEGTGLGLPLCKMFAELHGGKLALTSQLGKGTTVRIMFPAERNVELIKKPKS